MVSYPRLHEVFRHVILTPVSSVSLFCLNTAQNLSKPDPAGTPDRYQQDSLAGIGTRCSLVQDRFCPRRVKRTRRQALEERGV